jgi:hypothetical protein
MITPWPQPLESPGALVRAEADLSTKLRARSILFGDHLLPTYVTPFCVDGARLDRWIACAERLAAGIESVAQAALEDRALFEELRLQPAARPLLEIDPGYGGITTLSRPDAIANGDDLVFLEFNCDSPAMMAFADAVGASLLELDAFEPWRGRVQAGEMTGRLLQTLLHAWHEFGGSSTSPNIAITDWEGQKTRYEHRLIASAFEAAGCPTVVCDPRSFKRNGRTLEVDGRRIDVVYRRALFTELLARQSEVDALLGAYRDGAVCMVNSLRSYLASSKTLLALLCRKGAASEVASTVVLTPARIEELRRGPRSTVVKRGESHGGLHVLIPGVATDEEWTRALDTASREPSAWVEQEYHPVPQLTVLTAEGDNPRQQRKFFNWNPFLFAGRYAGSIARASDTPLINITLGGGLMPTFRVGEPIVAALSKTGVP